MSEYKSWRDDPGMKTYREYKKKFAWWPKICGDQKVWWETYYAVYSHWVHMYASSLPATVFENADERDHVDFDCNITEAEYLVRKLAESL